MAIFPLALFGRLFSDSQLLGFPIFLQQTDFLMCEPPTITKNGLPIDVF